MAASRKLYVELASTINRHVTYTDEPCRDALRSLVSDLCSDLKQDNMAFDRARFLDACGLS